MSAALEPLDAARRRTWHQRLITNDRNAPKALLANCLVALRESEEWHRALRYDEFSMRVALERPTPWGADADTAWSDQQDRLTAEWLQHKGIHVSVEVAGQAVQTVALERPFHSARDYLDGLQWDGDPRVDAWLATYAGVEPSNYSAAVGRCWLISGIARIYEPGAKVDTCLILEGEQGLLKSTALRILGGKWFTDELADLGSKDCALQTQARWIIELAELDSMSRSEVGRIKSFMSRSTDRFRPPYGRRVIESPRQCIFAGSVNHGTYLRDETGARRFWPVACRQIDTGRLANDRDQLWAEALALYRDGNPWWLNSADLIQQAATEQADRFEGDPWDDIIAAFIEGRPDVSISQILTLAVGKQVSMWAQVDKNRVARVLRSMGWERFQTGARNAREWRYRKAKRRCTSSVCQSTST